MKTHILYLEAYDDIHSVKDKMNWGQSQRILVVWPPRDPVLQTKFELVQIQRHAESLGSDLGLVVRDPQVFDFAKQLDIPAFRTMRRAQAGDWSLHPRPNLQELRPKNRFSFSEIKRELQQKKKKTDLQISSNGRIAWFSLGVGAFLAVAAFVLPSAEIHIEPQIEHQAITITVRAVPDLSSFTLAGDLPAVRQTIVVEGRDSMLSTGKIEVPQQPAMGEVEFTNLTDTPAVIPVGTVIRTQGEPIVRFTTLEPGEIAAQVGETTTIPVQANDPGEDGNLPADSLTLIEGNLGLRLSANNPEETNEGTNAFGPAPSLEDYNILRNRLLASLQQNAQEEAQGLLDEGGMIVSPSPLVKQILAEEYLPEELQIAAELSLILRVEFEVLIVRGRDINALATSVLNATLPSQYFPIGEEFQVEIISEPALSLESGLTWEIRISRPINSIINSSTVISLTKAQTPAIALQNIKSNLLLQESPEILLFPSWWPRLPFLALRINVEQGQ